MGQGDSKPEIPSNTGQDGPQNIRNSPGYKLQKRYLGQDQPPQSPSQERVSGHKPIKGLDPVQQKAHQQEMANQKAEGKNREARIDGLTKLFEDCSKVYDDLINKMPIQRQQFYKDRFKEIKSAFPDLIDDNNKLQTTSATKHSLTHRSEQRGQAEIRIREVVRQFIELPREIIMREELSKKLHASTHKLIQHMHESNTLWMQINSSFDLTPENDNHYYPMDGVKDLETVNLDSKLPRRRPDIMAVRWVLSLLGKNATGQEVATLVGPSDEHGPSPSRLQNTFQHFKTDYLYTKARLTIGDIEKVTKCGRPVLAHISKEGIGGSFVVIERVSRNKNDEPTCIIYDPKNQKKREVPYSNLRPALSDQYFLPIPKDWQTLSESAPETAVIQQRNFITESRNFLAEHQNTVQQALASYEQLRNNSQKYAQEQQRIKAKIASLLEKLHKTQAGITLDRDESGNQTPSITDLEKLEKEVAQYERRYQSITPGSKELLSKQSALEEYAQKQEAAKTERARLLKELDINTDSPSGYKRIKMQLWKFRTPEDTLYREQNELNRLYNYSKELHGKIAEVLNEDTPLTIRMQLQRILTPEDEIYRHMKKIEASCRKLKEIYQKMTASSQTIPEGQEANPDELPESAHTTKTEFKQLSEQIQQAIKESKELITTFNDFLKSQNYHPYYSMDGVKDLKTVETDSTLFGSCGIQTTRAELFFQGTDMEEATEERVAELANYKDGTTLWGQQKALKDFGRDSLCIDRELTIHDIERITGCGYPITIRVQKERLGSHVLLIGKVNWENGEPRCTIFDSYGEKIRDMPYRNLEPVLTDQSIVRTNYEELIKCVPGSDEMKLRRREANWQRSLNRMRQLEKKVAKRQEQYPDILEQSKQALSEYQQRQSDPEQYTQEQEAIKIERARLLKERDTVIERARTLDKEQQRIIFDDKSWEEYVSQHKGDYTKQEDIRSSFKRINSQLSNLYTSEEKLHIYLGKLRSLYTFTRNIHRESDSIHQDIVTEEQENGNLSTTTHPELTESVDTIKGKLEQLYKTIQGSLEKIQQKSHDLLNEFEDQVPQDKKRIIIDSTLANPSGNRCIRRILSGFDKHPTEQEVAELVGPFDEKGAPPWELLKALQHFNTGYSYTQAILTIGDIKELTKDGSRVLIHTRNMRNVGCFMVIEKVRWTQNGEPICTIYDPSDPKDQRIREVPYSKLKPFLSGHNLVPPKRLADTHEA